MSNKITTMHSIVNKYLSSLPELKEQKFINLTFGQKVQHVISKEDYANISPKTLTAFYAIRELI